MKKVINQYIVADPEIAGGVLTFAGTRVMVWQVLDALAHGETYKAILDAWPSITKEHIQAALQLAASRAESDRIISLAPGREVLGR
jgi:uncharacterized protein (DUF433 family)